MQSHSVTVAKPIFFWQHINFGTTFEGKLVVAATSLDTCIYLCNL